MGWASVSQAVHHGRTGGAERLLTSTAPKRLLLCFPQHLCSVPMPVSQQPEALYLWPGLLWVFLDLVSLVPLCDSAYAAVMFCDLGMLGHSDVGFPLEPPHTPFLQHPTDQNLHPAAVLPCAFLLLSSMMWYPLCWIRGLHQERSPFWVSG